jgi:hypothetical protein
VPPPTTEFDRHLRELEAEIRRLEVEYNLFFAGRLPKLPWETRSRVEALVKQYDRMHIQNTAERFRFQGLQSRFSTFCELWERSLRSREGARPNVRGRTAAEATTPSPIAGASAAGARPTTTSAPRPDTMALRDPESDLEKVRALHEKLNEARRRTGEADVPFERFQEVVRAQIAKVGNGSEVIFRVGVKDGRVTFTAKPTAQGAEDEG